jgi:hypothetical protein
VMQVILTVTVTVVAMATPFIGRDLQTQHGTIATPHQATRLTNGSVYFWEAEPVWQFSPQW